MWITFIDFNQATAQLHRFKYEHKPQSLFQACPFAHRPYELSVLDIISKSYLKHLDFIVYFILILNSYNKWLYIKH